MKHFDGIAKQIKSYVLQAARAMASSSQHFNWCIGCTNVRSPMLVHKKHFSRQLITLDSEKCKDQFLQNALAPIVIAPLQI